MNISIESIHAMSPEDRTKALEILTKSPIMMRTQDGKDMIDLLNYLSEDDPVSGTGIIKGMEVTVGAGADGEFGTADDTVEIKPKKKKLF